MTEPPNTTPLNEELDKLFEPLIDSPSLTLTSTYWNEAKQELTKLIQTLEKKARIDELNELLKELSLYTARHDEDFRSKSEAIVNERIAQLEKGTE